MQKLIDTIILQQESHSCVLDTVDYADESSHSVTYRRPVVVFIPEPDTLGSPSDVTSHDHNDTNKTLGFYLMSLVITHLLAQIGSPLVQINLRNIFPGPSSLTKLKSLTIKKLVSQSIQISTLTPGVVIWLIKATNVLYNILPLAFLCPLLAHTILIILLLSTIIQPFSFLRPFSNTWTRK